MKRYLDCKASDLSEISKTDLLYAIKASEGRIIISETIGCVQPILMDISNAEFAASQGADMLLLNMFDVENPIINGLPDYTDKENIIRTLKKLTGRVVGINLEPVDPEYINTNQSDDLWEMKNGRLATVENAAKAYEMGVNFIVLTGNPGNGISNTAICESLKAINKACGDKLILIAGKMHSAGILRESSEKIITEKDISAFIEAGANVILFPAPGTVPGITLEYIKKLVEYAHSLGAMAMTAIGTSQEGADEATIKQIALMAKMAGTDLHHIGDTGYVGMAIPENILTYSIAIRGKRHTYSRIAASVNR